jgi:hypothetical protein
LSEHRTAWLAIALANAAAVIIMFRGELFIHKETLTVRLTAAVLIVAMLCVLAFTLFYK